MSNKKRIFSLLIIAIILSLTSLSITSSLGVAQVADNRWSELLQLSSPDAEAGVPALVSDPYGYVHAFWREFNFLDRRPTIQYSRYNGAQWTVPQDIYAGKTGDEIQALNVSLASDDRLHLTWTGSQTGPVLYTTAPVTQAGIARDWSDPIRIEFPAFQAYLHSDPAGNLHLVYSIYFGIDRGLYYSRSDDQGASWSASQPLDLLRPPNYSPQSLEVVFTESGEFHLVWWDKDPEFFGAENGLVQYIHSLDGGKTWSQPFVIAGNNQGPPALLGFAHPLIAVQDGQVLIMWAEGDLPYRQSSYSPDHGINWTASTRIPSFADLHGQAFDTLAVDGQERVHYFGDIRYPQGIYHAIWDRERWFSPSMIYTVTPDENGQSSETSIHAHNLESAVLLGNQLIVSLMDSPSTPLRRLFVMSRVLEDVPQEEAISTPTPQVTPSPTPTIPPTIQPTSTQVWTTEMQSNAPPIPQNTTPATPIVVSAVFAGFLIFGVMFFRLRNTRK